MKIKTYIINLKEAIERKEYVLSEVGQYKFLDVELVTAVDGRKMSEREIQTRFDSKRFAYRFYEPSPGEIGCTLSHRECYKRLLDSSEEFALICEDDVCFLVGEELMSSLLKEVIERMPHRPYVMTLSRHLVYYAKGGYQIGEYSFCRVYHAWGTCAYLINRKAAEVMLRTGKPYYPADDYREMGRLGIRVEGVYPMLAIGKSEIGEVPTSITQSYKMNLRSRIRGNIIGKIKGFLIRINYLKKRENHMKIVDTRNS